ncbi:MAG: hypothetical protein ACRDDL_01795 [Sarcina sp.]
MKKFFKFIILGVGLLLSLFLSFISQYFFVPETNLYTIVFILISLVCVAGIVFGVSKNNLVRLVILIMLILLGGIISVNVGLAGDTPIQTQIIEAPNKEAVLMICENDVFLTDTINYTVYVKENIFFKKFVYETDYLTNPNYDGASWNNNNVTLSFGNEKVVIDSKSGKVLK